MNPFANLFFSFAVPCSFAVVAALSPAAVHAEGLPEYLPIVDAGIAAVDNEYHTPLAGEAFRGEVAGKAVSVPARDRDYVVP